MLGFLKEVSLRDIIFHGGKPLGLIRAAVYRQVDRLLLFFYIVFKLFDTSSDSFRLRNIFLFAICVKDFLILYSQPKMYRF